MSDSLWSVVVVDEGSLGVCAGPPVVPDGGGHGQQPLGGPGVDACGSPAAVAFQVELAFEGVVDRFDPLADPADGSVPGCLAAPVGADQAHAVPGGDQLLEVAPGEAFVPDQGQSRPQRAGAAGVGEQPGGD